MGDDLVAVAREAIAGGQDRQPPSAGGSSGEHGASFVTLTLDGRLRGCIGTLRAHRPLLDDVRANARAAAFRDPRFPPLAANELDRVDIEVSVLTPPEPMAFTDEADLLAQLVPHVDGVVFEASERRATFLPQVWRHLPEPADFLAALKRKAGVASDFWDADVRVSRYRVHSHAEVRR